MYLARSWKKKFLESLQWSYKESAPYFTAFGVAVIIGVLGFYFINPVVIDGDVYENLGLRIASGVLMVPLILKPLWPQRLARYFVYYWYSSFIFVLPFFFTFMLLKNPSSNIWHMNGLICLFVMVLFVDLVSLLFLLFIGVSAGFFFYYIGTDGIVTLPEQLVGVLFCYLGPLIYVVLFSRKRERIQQQKLDNMKLVAESVAHELRTPLSSMTLAAQALGRLLPVYSEAYTLARKANLPVKPIACFQQENLEDLPSTLDTVSRNANSMVTLMLANLREETKFDLQLCSMAGCVQAAIDAYPFSLDERALVLWPQVGEKTDFTFIGQSELMKHVIFNLLKNALHAIAQADKGHVTIHILPSSTHTDHADKRFNKLVFVDTGTGIEPHKICHIFDRFYTNKEHGTGIGLAFCRATIQEFGGRITCTSKLGEHTTFTLYLPAVD